MLLATLGFYPEVHGLRELLGVYHRATGDEDARLLASRYRRVLALLERGYTESRYGLGEYSPEEVEEALEAAGRVLKLVEERLGMR